MQFFYETMQFVTKNMILKKKQLENFVVSFRIEFKIYSSQFENNSARLSKCTDFQNKMKHSKNSNFAREYVSRH